MKRTLMALVLALAAAGNGFAQSPPAGNSPVPKLIRVYREELAVGKRQAHADFESKYVEAFRAAGWPVHYLALQSFTGPQEAWFLEGYDSWAALGKAEADMEKQPVLGASLRDLDERDASFLSKQSTFVATFREDMSYRAGTVNLAKMRYMAVTIVRVKPGMSEAAEEAIKMLAAGYEKAGVTNFQWALFQGVSGLISPTYIAMRPLGSLAEMDGSFADALRKAEGEEASKKRVQRVRDSYYSSDTRLFSFSPRMSYVRQEFIDQDPEFWAPRPKAAPAAAMPKKKTK